LYRKKKNGNKNKKPTMKETKRTIGGKKTMKKPVHEQ
jgi:hypothetical protein